jgi:ATP-dependent phosphofructokinase / diphosphate-dependent phosphofructokinase
LKLAISTGGGDAPGLNAVICAVVRGAERLGYEVYDYVPLADAVARTRLVPPDAHSVLTARTLGIAFGD